MSVVIPAFGEWLRNTYASPTNPQRDGRYVEYVCKTGGVNAGKYYRLTDGKGKFWLCPIGTLERVEGNESKEVQK